MTEIHTGVDRGGSNLGEALELGSALLPSDANGGIAVISDGAVTGVRISDGGKGRYRVYAR